jgi:hypothetical protein
VGIFLWRLHELFKIEQAPEKKLLEEAIQSFYPSTSEGTKPLVDVAKLAKAIAGVVGIVAGSLAGDPLTGAIAGTAGLQLLSVMTDNIEWKLPIGLGSPSAVSDQDERAQKLLGAVNRLIASFQEKIQPIVLVIDGLDRLANWDTIEAIFIRSSLPYRLECKTLMAAPLLLRRQGKLAQARANARVLTEVPVLNQQNPWGPGPLQEFFYKLYQARTSDLQVQLGREQLQKLGRYSGGRLRDFIRLIRNVADLAWEEDQLAVSEKLVNKAIDDFRRKLESGLRTSHIKLLQEVAADPAHRLPDRPGDYRDIVGEALQNFWLLPYPNESEWYFPHPLLTLSILKPPG